MVDVAGTSLSEEERQFLSTPAVGGVILFSRNFESRKQVTSLAEEIKQIRNPALLIAVDQEGGRVQRFRDEFFALPPLHTIGNLYDTDQEAGLEMSFAAGLIMASEILQCGIDLSFAPVLDCANPNSQVIGDRGFHGDPESITSLAENYIAGMNQAGMKATGKHFPGHGNVDEDSHHELPKDSRWLDDLLSHDMAPYRKLGSRLDAIMTAHVLFPEVDTNIPAFSPRWLKEILRSQVGFEGVIFSDDLTMRGAEMGLDIANKVNRALTSGCTMALICNDPENARRAAAHRYSEFPDSSSLLMTMTPERSAKTTGSTLESSKNLLESLV